jgi:hypothetical protein
VVRHSIDAVGPVRGAWRVVAVRAICITAHLGREGVRSIELKAVRGPVDLGQLSAIHDGRASSLLDGCIGWCTVAVHEEFDAPSLSGNDAGHAAQDGGGEA